MPNVAFLIAKSVEYSGTKGTTLEYGHSNLVNEYHSLSKTKVHVVSFQNVTAGVAFHVSKSRNFILHHS